MCLGRAMYKKLEDMIIRKARKRRFSPKVERFLLNWAAARFSHYEALELESLSNYTDCQTIDVYPEEVAICSYIKEDGEIENYPDGGCYPEIKIKALNNVKLFSGASYFISDNKAYTGKLNVERSSKIDISFDYAIQRERRLIAEKFDSEIIEEAIYISGVGSWNWYHWLTEILPKLILVSQYGKGYENIPIAVCETSYSIPSIKASLDYFADGREIIVLKRYRKYHFNKVVTADAPTYCLFDSAVGAWTAPSDCLIHKSAYDDVKRHMSRLHAEVDDKDLPKRIFLMRRSDLRKYNQEEIMNIAEGYGFKPIYTEDYSVHEQAALFENADFIVGPSGAAWANMIFSGKKTSALCWVLKQAAGSTVFANLATASGVKLKYFLVDHPIEDLRDIHLTEYRLEPKAFKAALNELINA